MEPIRLQKFLSEQGVCSRRDAETRILEGRITINGKLAELGQKVMPGKDHVKVDGKLILIRDEAPLTLVMNKPRGVVCSNDDPHNPDTVFDLLDPKLRSKRLYCAGRLDKDSEGLLILTNDGDLANKLTHPSHNVIKRYRVLLNRPFDQSKIPNMLNGIMDEGELLNAHKIIPAKYGDDAAKRLEVHLVQGRKREIRRLFDRFGYQVKRLRRIQIGNYVMKGIPKGSARVLKEKEIRLLLAN